MSPCWDSRCQDSGAAVLHLAKTFSTQDFILTAIALLFHSQAFQGLAGLG